MPDLGSLDVGATLSAPTLQLALDLTAESIFLAHLAAQAREPFILYANPEVQRSTGYTSSELIGRPVSILAGRDTDRTLFEGLDDAACVGETTRARILLYRKDSSAYWADVSASRIRDHAEGGPLFLVVVDDVDEKVRLQVFVDMGVDMISRHDAFGTYLAVSPACRELTGYSPSELLGRRSVDLIHPDDVRRLSPFSATPDVYDVRYRIVCKNGLLKWVESRSRIVRNPKNPADILEVHAATRDITEALGRERELRESADRYRELFESNPSPAWIYDPESFKILAVNRQALAHYGYSRVEFAALTLADIRPPEDVAGMTHDIKRRTEALYDHGEWRHVKHDGSIIDVLVVSSIIEWEGRSARLALMRDTTAENEGLRELQAYRERLEQSEAALAAAQTVAHIGSWDLDIASDSVIWSDELYRIYGLTREDFPSIPGTLWQFYHPDDVAEVRRQYDDAFYGDKNYSMTHRLRRRDGSVRWVHEIGNFHRDAAGVVLREVGTIQDVTERKVAEDRLAFLAHFDALTGLPNRVLLEDRLQQALFHAKRANAFVAVAFLDIDHFKNINDSLGHSSGDSMLRKMAERLSGGLREGDTVCRYSGDEFILLLGGFESLGDISPTVQRLLTKLVPPFTLAGKTYKMSASIGVSVFPHDGSDLESLVKHADVAMYQAKANGRGAIRFYSSEMQEEVDKRLALESELRAAIVAHEFRLVYQPIVELATGKIVSAEALIRWEHPRLGMRLPADFISVAEDTGMIVPIGKWVLHQACADAKLWRSLDHSDVSVAVNVSSVQFRNPDLVEHVSTALADSALPVENLHLEITESLLMDHERALEITTRLSSFGIRLVLDDFGTGFSSLGTLGRFPIKGLKIDRSFVDRIEHDEQARTISRTIVSLARSLGLTTVAEGIENDAQLAMLMQFGCKIGQGYFFYKPMAEGDFRKLLAANKRLVI